MVKKDAGPMFNNVPRPRNNRYVEIPDQIKDLIRLKNRAGRTALSTRDPAQN